MFWFSFLFFIFCCFLFMNFLFWKIWKFKRKKNMFSEWWNMFLNYIYFLLFLKFPPKMEKWKLVWKWVDEEEKFSLLHHHFHAIFIWTFFGCCVCLMFKTKPLYVYTLIPFNIENIYILYYILYIYISCILYIYICLYIYINYLSKLAKPSKWWRKVFYSKY